MTQNPFQQSDAYWRVRFPLPQGVAMVADEYFTDGALSVASVEEVENPAIWQMEILYAEKPDAGDIERRIGVLAELHGMNAPGYTLARLEARDWVAAMHYDFPPLAIGRFYIHGSHISAPPPAASYPLLIDAGLAFGSGEHATTASCLRAFERLGKRRRFLNVLDVGAGSAILAMAAARRFPASRVLASDVDPVAVRVAAENIRLNRLHGRVQACVAAGVQARRIRAGAPYELIFANILARPLVKLAPSITRALAPGGALVLSGLLWQQRAMVMSAYRAQGLYLSFSVRSGDWAALVMEKRSKEPHA